jgi:hypothetical protein
LRNNFSLFSKASEQGLPERQAKEYSVASNGHPYATDAGQKAAAGTWPKPVYHDRPKMMVAVIVER